jgi:hypothetical protein
MGIWSQARTIAAQAPADRNRYVDFLRAASILVVITGHWLIAALYYRDGTLVPGAILELQPWTQWLTWLFQVMPIFFFVGGYANAVSLESAGRRNLGYAGWLVTRLNRLVTPLIALLAGWALLAAILHFCGVGGGVIRLASRAALIPIWFLAIYIMIVVLALACYFAWRRWGFASLWALVAAAALVDAAFFLANLQWLGWSNYFGFGLPFTSSVSSGGTAAPEAPAACSPVRPSASAPHAAGLRAVSAGMVGSPDENLSNTLPPKVTLLALAAVQFGLLLWLESPIRRFLSGPRVWAATVLVNGMIMTVYLWHLTVLAIMVALAYAVGGFGLRIEPGSSEWWLTRPLWIAVLYVVLLPVAVSLAGLERRARSADAPVPPAARQVGGAVLLCLGLALLARFGFGDAPLPGLDLAAFAMAVAGAGISGVLTRAKKRHKG